LKKKLSIDLGTNIGEGRSTSRKPLRPSNIYAQDELLPADGGNSAKKEAYKAKER
jgi:hypothetical protein